MDDDLPGSLSALLHKGLRARLWGVLEEFGRTDWSQPTHSERTLAGLNALLLQLDVHERTEDSVFHAAMEACEPGASAVTAGDHVRQAEARAELHAAAAELHRTPPSRRNSLAARLANRLALYLADCIEHMLCEELENAPFLRARLGVAALAGLERESLRRMEPDAREQLMAWTLPMLTPDERIYLRRVAGAREPRAVHAGHEKSLAMRPGLCQAASYKPNCSW